MMEAVRWLRCDGVIVSLPEPETLAMPGKLRLLDQTLLPEREVYFCVDDLPELVDAIRRLAVRGAPAIGCAAALGMAAVAQHYPEDPAAFGAALVRDAEILASARPTAVNLRYAVERILAIFRQEKTADKKTALACILKGALDMLREDIQLCSAIGRYGADLLPDGAGVLTHCNAGALATAGTGTALAPVYAAAASGRRIRVYSDETRPLLQGSRLTAWELHREGIEVWTICDNMAGLVMREGRINIVIVGADRIAANGDTANKIGTYSVAVLARYHRIPFYVAAPYTTFDLSLADGGGIPIEERDPEEIRRGFGRMTAPDGIRFYNPAFDVTPAELITGFITDRGILKPPFSLQGYL